MENYKIKMKPKKENCCVDCGKYAIKHKEDYFMATDELWKKHGVGRSILCLTCFTKRLNRDIRAEDFVLVPASKQNPIINKLLQ